jgi:hypothetical protein
VRPGTLQEVLLVERQLREELEAERKRASDWLEARRREASRAHEARVEKLRTEFALARATAQERAKGASLTLQAPDPSFDEGLKQRIRAAIVATLPEAVRAH